MFGKLSDLWGGIEIAILTTLVVLVGMAVTAQGASPAEMFGAVQITPVSLGAFDTVPQAPKQVYQQPAYNNQQTYPVGIFRGGCAGGCSNCSNGACGYAGACGQAGCSQGAYCGNQYGYGGYGIAGRRSRPLLPWRR
jgi:hypothetical protein